MWKLEQIKEEPFFKDFDWDALISLSFNVPYKVDMKDPVDNKEDIKPVPYLTYLQAKKKNVEKKKINKRKSIGQVDFEKWLKNF